MEQELLHVQEQVDQKRKILRALTEESFLQNVSNQCAKELQNNNNKQSKWSRGGSSSSSDGGQVAAKVSSVLQQEFQKVIGDEGLTEDEQNAKKFKDLQEKSGSSSSSRTELERDDKLSGLLAEQNTESEGEAEESVVLVEDGQGQKVVKKSVFRI